MTTEYLIFLAIGAVFCTALFGVRLRSVKIPVRCAWVSAVSGAILGAILSKLLYFMLLFREQYDNYGMGALLRMPPEEFSFVGGCLGVCIAVILSAKCFHLPVRKVLDIFAPCGALMVFFARAGEYWLNLVGYGTYVENESLQFFPIAVKYVEYDMIMGWFYAIFVLEAIFALICAIVFLTLSRSGRSSSLDFTFLHTLFFLTVPQVFSESLRSQCMKWGFVRIEQLICGLIAFAIVVFACIRYRKKASFLRVYYPVIGSVICLLMMIVVEFALDKPFFGVYLPKVLCYGVMIAFLFFFAVLEIIAFRRLKRLSIQS